MKTLLVAVMLLAVAAPPSPAADWSLGTNLGVNFISPDHGESSTAIALPAAVGGFQPGFRLGYLFDNPRHELFVDAGLLLYSLDSYSNNAVEMTANYQWNIFAGKELSPYLTAGFGFMQQSTETADSDLSGTSGIFGLGFGVRRLIAGRAGSLPAELRYDRVTEAKDGETIVVPDGSTISIKLGDDLWIRR